MMDMHGIIYAFHASEELGVLKAPRTAASLPYCGGYRLIDFSLSSMTNAGIRDVGVIMHRDYQSLLDHLGGGKEWGLNRRDGGLRMLPPFGTAHCHRDEYSGCMEALIAVRPYIEDIRQKYVILTKGNLVGNVDIAKAYESHIASGADMTAICSHYTPTGDHHRFVCKDNRVEDILYYRTDDKDGGVTSLEMYILEKDVLLELINYCSAHRLFNFHLDAIAQLHKTDKHINVFMHEGYWRHIASVGEYFKSNMDMLDRGNLGDIFSTDMVVRTREHADVSTYYGDMSSTENCLIADGCKIDGSVKNCIIFRGCVVEKGAKLSNCILMQGTVVKNDTELKNVICDKNVVVSEGAKVAGIPSMPYIVPKGVVI